MNGYLPGSLGELLRHCQVSTLEWQANYVRLSYSKSDDLFPSIITTRLLGRDAILWM